MSMKERNAFIRKCHAELGKRYARQQSEQHCLESNAFTQTDFAGFRWTRLNFETRKNRSSDPDKQARRDLEGELDHVAVILKFMGLLDQFEVPEDLD